jgi:hypothetical protein
MDVGRQFAAAGQARARISHLIRHWDSSRRSNLIWEFSLILKLSHM